MEMRLCPICEKRPGKRSCPALAGWICSVCCARDRMIKLKCPESCEYLQSGRKAAIEKIGQERIRFIERQGIPYDQKVAETMRTVVIFEGSIIEAQRMELKSLKDQDIADGIDTAIRTLATFQSGLLYNHQAETAAGQLVSDSILKTVELIQREADPANPLKPAAIAGVLKMLRIILDFHLQRGEDGRDYIRFVSQFFSYPEEEKRSLIIT